MPIVLSHKLFKNYLKVEITGVRTPGSEELEMIEIWTRVAQLCSQFKQWKVLAIMKIYGRLPIDSAYKIAKATDDYVWSRGYKLAVVAPEETLFMNIKLSETLWVNMGYEAKLFSSAWRAKKWLLSQKTVDLS